MASRGILFIISGPAGSGKGTVVKALRSLMPSLALSVSATTRQPRPGEAEGVSYYFKSRSVFEKMIADGEILEHTEYMGNYYGTLSSEVRRCLDEGLDLVLEIEVEGAGQIKKLYPDSVAVMLIPPDSCTLEARLRGRGTETEEVIVGRLARGARGAFHGFVLRLYRSERRRRAGGVRGEDTRDYHRGKMPHRKNVGHGVRVL